LRTQTQRKETDILPSFVKGEKRFPPSFRKETKPANQFTEPHYRAMETAGKQVDDEDYFELMKETVLDVHPREPNIIENLSNANISRNKKTGFANADWYSTD
jgi:hypothetical protein